eukprot:9047518-Ditylum_brightwellii.AAC.1
MVANRHSKKWTIMYSPKIEVIVDVDNDSVKEVLVATASNSCANIQPIKTKVSGLVSDFMEVVKLTSTQQKNFIIGSKLKKDDVADCGSTYIIRLPVTIPIIAEHGIKLSKTSNLDCINTMESYHPAVGMWTAAIKYQAPGKNGISKVKMNEDAYAPANDEAISIINSAGIVLAFITSGDKEDKLFLKALQICLNNLRPNNKKDYYIANPDQDPNATLIKQ